MWNIFSRISPPFFALHETTRPFSKRTVKSSISCPAQLSGLVATSVPSQLPRMGLVKTSSVGMLGT